MAPGVRILRSEPLSAEQRTLLQQFLSQLGRVHSGRSPVDGGEQLTVWATQYDRLGMHVDDPIRPQEVLINPRNILTLYEQFAGLDPFAIWTCVEGIPQEEASEEHFALWAEVDELHQMRHLLGFDPTYQIEVSAVVTRPYGRDVVYRIALWIAQELGGFVDMGEDVSPTALWQHTERSVEFYERAGLPGPRVWPEEERRKALRDYLQQYPGRALEIRVWLAPGRDTISHIVDATFLKAWLQYLNSPK